MKFTWKNKKGFTPTPTLKKAKLVWGFTMVEVIVVIGIVGILTAIIFPSISQIRAKNRDTERVADIATLQLGLSLYKNQQEGAYPNTLQELKNAGYVPEDAIYDPNGTIYPYMPLKKGTTSAKCIYYHLGAQLELPSAQVNTDDVFNSSNKNTVTNEYEWCGVATVGIDGTTNTMYDVRP